MLVQCRGAWLLILKYLKCQYKSMCSVVCASTEDFCCLLLHIYFAFKIFILPSVSPHFLSLPSPPRLGPCCSAEKHQRRSSVGFNVLVTGGEFSLFSLRTVQILSCLFCLCEQNKTAACILPSNCQVWGKRIKVSSPVVHLGFGQVLLVRKVKQRFNKLI